MVLSGTGQCGTHRAQGERGGGEGAAGRCQVVAIGESDGPYVLHVLAFAQCVVDRPRAHGDDATERDG